MLNSKQRNRKISHLIESAIHDFCKVLGCSYYTRDEAIMVQNDDDDLFFVFPEFNNDNYKININCMVFSDLTLSRTTKLKEVYRSDVVADYLAEAKASLWFLDDTRMVMSCVERSKYDEYAILKSKLLLGFFANFMNAKKLKDKLEASLVNLAQVSVN